MRRFGTVALVSVILAGCGSSPGDNPATAATGPALTGYGATTEDWNAHHSMDPRFAEGSAYDADPALSRGTEPDKDDRYYGVQHVDGRVNQYSMRFAPGTTIADAKRTVLRTEFPRDAKPTLRSLDTCAILTVTSETLRAAGGSATVSAEFVSGGSDRYDPDDVWEAILSFGELTEC